MIRIMKNIRSYCANKYNNKEYEKVEDNIYKTSYSPNWTSYEQLKDKELINILKDIKDWKKVDDVFYMTEYESTKYYIDCEYYETGCMDIIYVISPCKEEQMHRFL